jgi:glycosyltransferase involved in cell wall biosynthesis
MNATPKERSMARPTLGVVAIAKDEERDLPGFLGHLLPWVDEIVIVDDASTDRTVEIARAAGPKVRVIEHPMDPEAGFAGQRNVGIAAATCDWLLHLDVDDRVTPELALEMRAAIQDPTKDAYRYRLLNYFLHHRMVTGGWECWNNIRLARRGRHRFAKAVHETCVVDAPPERIGQLRQRVWHLGDESYAERIDKNRRYAQLEAKRILASSCEVRWYHLLFWPAYRALKAYLVRQGFRQGTLGLLHALYTFTGTFNWYACAWDEQHRPPREALERQVAAAWRAAWAEGRFAELVCATGPR